MTLGQLRERITISEFVGWLDYLEWEQEYHSKQDYYLAQIATEIQRSYSKHPRKVKLDSFLIKFKRVNEVSEKTKRSKEVWLAALKIKVK